MAERAKRERKKAAKYTSRFEDDSDDDFCPTSRPPAKKSKIAKKKVDKVGPFTSTQLEPGGRNGRPPRKSQEDILFDEELHAALKLSEQDLKSGPQVSKQNLKSDVREVDNGVIVLNSSSEASVAESVKKCSQETADTVILTDNEAFQPVSDEEELVVPAAKKKNRVIDSDDDFEVARKSDVEKSKRPSEQWIVNKAEDKSKNADGKKSAIVNKEAGDRKTASVSEDADNTKATDDKKNEERLEKFGEESRIEKSPITKSETTKSESVAKQWSDPIYDDPKPSTSSKTPARKAAQKKKRKTSESDDYEESSGEDEGMSASDEEEFVPKSKQKKKPPVAKPKKGKVQEVKQKAQQPKSVASPAAVHKPAVKPLRPHNPVSPKATAISAPTTVKPVPGRPLLVSPASTAPRAMKSPLLTGRAASTKIPAWTPPARVGKDTGGDKQTVSPAIGLRVGLSRNFKSGKPLHTKVKTLD